MTDEKCENLSPTVVQYEQFLNDTLRGDLKYVKWSYADRAIY